VIATPVPVGVYHLTQTDADRVSRVAAFYSAYNSHDLGASMVFLSTNPTLFDCDYQTHESIRVEGRAAVEAFLRARIADGDHWVVEFYKDAPADVPLRIVVYPVERANGTLARLGAVDGKKRSFNVVLAMDVLPSGQIDTISWATGGPGVAKHLCVP